MKETDHYLSDSGGSVDCMISGNGSVFIHDVAVERNIYLAVHPVKGRIPKALIMDLTVVVIWACYLRGNVKLEELLYMQVSNIT